MKTKIFSYFVLSAQTKNSFSRTAGSMLNSNWQNLASLIMVKIEIFIKLKKIRSYLSCCYKSSFEQLKDSFFKVNLFSGCLSDE